MPTNWIIPTADNVAQVISAAILAKANENIDAPTITAAMANPDSRKNYDPELDDRLTEQVNLAVAQFRGAIQLCGKTPLSVTLGSVPPECFKHVLSLAAFGLVSSTLNLQYVIATEKGDMSPLAANFRIANAYLEQITKGRICVAPTDPAGRDYINPINVKWCGLSSLNPYPAYDATKPFNPPVEAVRFGAGSPPADLQTYDSLFNVPTPPWFPAESIGQP